MDHYMMNLTLKVWRQKNGSDRGGFETYEVKDISSGNVFPGNV
jgi:succinate dehydrogenase / fumarate reductase iron-sulfur subunit